jgi:Ca-activated chloride channel homolog
MQVTARPFQLPTEAGVVRFFLTASAKGDPPAALQKEELSAVVDGTAAQIKGVRPAKDDPLLFAVLVDISKSDAAAADSVREAAFQLFRRLGVGQNQGYLGFFNHRLAMTRTTIPVSQVRQALDAAVFEGGTAVYDAIGLTCRQKLSRSGNPDRTRRLIVLISDGEDNSSHVTHGGAEESALEEGVSVFSIVTKSPLGGERGEAFMKEISHRTGGFSTEKDLNQAVPASLAAIDAQWELTVALASPADKKLHPMQIKCKQKDVRISSPSDVFLE